MLERHRARFQAYTRKHRREVKMYIQYGRVWATLPAFHRIDKEIGEYVSDVPEKTGSNVPCKLNRAAVLVFSFWSISLPYIRSLKDIRKTDTLSTGSRVMHILACLGSDYIRFWRKGRVTLQSEAKMAIKIWVNMRRPIDLIERLTTVWCLR